MPTAPRAANIVALPDRWNDLWGAPSPFHRRELRAIKGVVEDLATDVELVHAGDLAHMVHPQQNRLQPVHRWYQYKEAFSPRLPKELLKRLGAGSTRTVVDPFAGVATTQLSLQGDPRVDQVVGVEYSPFAHFVGRTKLSWPTLDPVRLRSLVRRAETFKLDRRAMVPSLAAFSNEEIFSPQVALALASARDHIRRLHALPSEKDFLLLGLASIVEDASGAMKDGRALRIARGRRRRATSMVGELVRPTTDGVRRALAAQWQAMLEDLDLLSDQRERRSATKAHHLLGDARELAVLANCGASALPAESAGLFVYSPPYLNCIDYTEVYKLELWLLEFATDRDSFRNLRLGTLRSHPSIEFPARDYSDTLADEPVFQLTSAISSFVAANHARPAIGRMIANYFDDMLRVLQEQHRVLEDGGHAVCVVANSTFSNRERVANGYDERWRVPVLTDLLVAKIALLAGFAEACIWAARDLRPRNVTGGAARESLVVMTKA